jgi:hypothetical protein
MKLILQKACSMVLKRYREGEPLRILTVGDPVEPLSYQVNPLVFRKKAAVLFADGGVGKSTVGLLVTMLVARGETVAGISALKGRPLYLDWEDDEEVHKRRMNAIAASHPSLKGAQIHYQPCNGQSLNMLAHTILRRIQTEQITFVVVDSLAASTRGDTGAEAATELFGDIRQLQVGCLFLGHIAKNVGEGQDPSIYGSVFFKNFARSTWELKKEQEVSSDVSILGLVNRKSNLSRTHEPIGLKVTQNNAAIHYEPFDLTQANELSKVLPAASQIRTLLESDGMPRFAKDIAEETGLPLATVKSTLSRDQGRKWQKIGEGRDTKWTVLSGGK